MKSTIVHADGTVRCAVCGATSFDFKRRGITGKKRDFTSLPLTKIQASSIEPAGTLDLDAELELWFSGLSKFVFEFSGRTDVAYLNKLVAHHIL